MCGWAACLHASWEGAAAIVADVHDILRGALLLQNGTWNVSLPRITTAAKGQWRLLNPVKQLSQNRRSQGLGCRV